VGGYLSPKWHIGSDTSNLMAQDKLKETLTEIQLLKKEVQEECNKRRNAERELQSALQKVQALLTMLVQNLD
jgi:hypothetical protein